MGTVISFTKCSQVTGLIQKVSRSSSEVSSLRAAVLRAAVFCSKIIAIVMSSKVRVMARDKDSFSLS